MKIKNSISVGVFILLFTAWANYSTAGTIGGGNQGRCEMLQSEATEVCTGKRKNRICEVTDSFCGNPGNNGSCSCAPDCEANGSCCADYKPVCKADFGGCEADSDQIAVLHVGGMCSTQWDYPDNPDRLTSIANTLSVDVRAVQTENAGTQVAAQTLTRYLDSCCTGSNSCIVYNYSNGDNVIGYALDRLATVEQTCTGKRMNRVCTSELAWNILEVRTSAGAGGGSELSNWGGIADLFACDLASELSPSKVRNLFNHSNTRGVPVYHIGGFLDQSGSDDTTLNAGWWLLPWHNDGAVAFHSAGARSSVVEWCGDFWFPPLWCDRENICDDRYGNLYGGHQMAFCENQFRNSDHYDQKMEYIRLME